jgi:hypothetical protein
MIPLFNGVIDTVDQWSSVSLTPLATKKVDFIVKYLSEDKAVRKKAFTHGPGAQMELFDEKNRRSKIS